MVGFPKVGNHVVAIENLHAHVHCTPGLPRFLPWRNG
jgi:hypothetical protein